ncbi:MAG: flagellar hook-basal body complex protein [Deltaproteobacteria bacterium]|jgi:flagellar hook-basal body protein|nr:flagellar hook-basal body complex protein [Deltaproteobacteria bacterium]
MSISSAMYAAVTGLSALSTGMQVISNNIANVNTVGFKAGRTNFEDLISQDYWSNGRTQQIGRGVKVASVQQMFTQGSFINSAQDTDMAITGDGFFQVRDPVTNDFLYTRAGNFTIDAKGNLETPAHYILQGWEMSIPKPGQDPKCMGVPVDVKVIIMNAPPVETSQIKVVCNLNSDDINAFPYSQEGWAEIYASEIAMIQAEKVRQPAADRVYSAAIHKSTYPTVNPASRAFNQAYENYMTQVLGYTAGVGAFLPPPGVPDPAAVALAVANSAYASAQSAVKGLSANNFTSGINSPSVTFRTAFYNTYKDRMSASGYSYFGDESSGYFYIESARTTALNSAAHSACSAANILPFIDGYPMGVPPAPNQASADSYNYYYKSFMLNSAKARYSSALDIFYSSAIPVPTANSALAHANASGSAAYLAIVNPYAYPPGTQDAFFDQVYGDEYMALMESKGFVYQGLTFTKTPSASEISAALDDAKNAVLDATPYNPTAYPAVFPINPSTAYNSAFNAAYEAYMANNGFYLSGTTFKAIPSPATSDAARLSAISVANLKLFTGGTLTGYPMTAGSPAGLSLLSANAFNDAYSAYMHSPANGNYEYSATLTSFIRHPLDPSSDTLQSAMTSAIRSGLEAYQNYPIVFSAVTANPDNYIQNIIDVQYKYYMTTVLEYKHLGYKFFQMVPSPEEVKDVNRIALETAQKMAANAGENAYQLEKKRVYEKELQGLRDSYVGKLWQLEGNGYADAWDGSDLSSPMDPENYTHANPWTIYDSLGNAHTLMVYYQPNPHMENVWDYIITCDPTEDARKDSKERLLMNGATFDGLIQKGKITFTADGPDRHGGVIKDIEAQNLDLTKTAAAQAYGSGDPTVKYPLTANSLSKFSLGGYYKGSPDFCAATGTMEASKRTYTMTYHDSLGKTPDVSGFRWIDSSGITSGTFSINDSNFTGPYPFGSGLTIDFTSGGVPMSFSEGDSLTVVAKSESIGWEKLEPNTLGYFEFNVAFVQSASLALHPPYPEGLPTIIQNISLDMGARKPLGQGSWILDEQGTTQFASESINIFSSQDGYPAGSLQRVSIDKDGILTGIYTNGRQQPLYKIGLVRFLNPWGLAKLGDNVYMQTRWSGIGCINPPGFGGTGTIRANFLEQSNTDLADEIVNMIVTQRGFQANSKVVTTTDTMLAEVIEMKR